MDGCRFAVNSDMKQYLEEKPGMFTDVERISKEAEEQLDDLGYDDAFLKELFEYLIHREK